MGLFGCFKSSAPALPDSLPGSELTCSNAVVKQEGHPAQPKFVSNEDLVAVLQLDEQSSSVTGLAWFSLYPHVPPPVLDCPAEDTSRLICRLRASRKRACTAPSIEIPLSSSSNATHPGMSEAPQSWLRHAQVVAANKVACRTWGTQDLGVMTKGLSDLAQSNTTLHSILADVASFVSGPMDAFSASKPLKPCSSWSLPGGPSIKVSSSYIRDPDDGSLRPALVLEIQGSILSAQPPAVVSRPISQPMVTHRIESSAVHTTFESPGLGPSVQLTHQPWPSRGSTEMSQGLASSSAMPEALVRSGSQQVELMRASAMLSAVPCIATLLELSPTYPSQHGSNSTSHSPASLQVVPGRILMQNEQSMEFWGKLDPNNMTGAQELLAALFMEDTDAAQHMMQHLEAQLQTPNPAPRTFWKSSVQVTCWRGRHLCMQKQALSSNGIVQGGPKSASDTDSAHPHQTHPVHQMLQPRSSEVSVLQEPSLSLGLPTPSWYSTSRLTPSSAHKNSRPSLQHDEHSLHGRSTVQTLHRAISSLADDDSQFSVDSAEDLPRTPDSNAYDHAAHQDTALTGSRSASYKSGLISHSSRHTSQPVATLSPQRYQPAKSASGCFQRVPSVANMVCQVDFPSLPDPRPPSVTTRVMKLSLLTSTGTGVGSGTGTPSGSELRQGSQVEHMRGVSSCDLSVSRRFVSVSGSERVTSHASTGHARSAAITQPSLREVQSSTVVSPVHAKGSRSKAVDALLDQPSPIHLVDRSRDLQLPWADRSVFADKTRVNYVSRRHVTGHQSLDMQRLRSMDANHFHKDLQVLSDDSTGEQPEQEVAGFRVPSRTSPFLIPEHVDEITDSAEDSGNEDDDSSVTVLTHEVEAVLVVDPVTGNQAVLLLQSDITSRAFMEKRMAALTESQLTMLENMLPRQVLEYAIGGLGPIGSLAFQHDEVTVLFMDIVGFTSMSKEVQPHLVMEFLNNLFSELDEMCETFDVYKVDTAGDCYIVAGALMAVDEDGFMTLDENADPYEGARNVVGFAEELMIRTQNFKMPHDGRPTAVRVGIHTGSVVSGLVGTKMFKFSLFGDTMNTSSRMESTSMPGYIQVSKATYDMLDEVQQHRFKPTGGVEVKGKGHMATYVYSPSVRGPASMPLMAIDEEWAPAPPDGQIVLETDSCQEQQPGGELSICSEVQNYSWCNATMRDFL